MSDYTFRSHYVLNLYEEGKSSEKKFDTWDDEDELRPTSLTEEDIDKKLKKGVRKSKSSINISQSRKKKERKHFQREVAIEILYCFGEEGGKRRSLNNLKKKWHEQSNQYYGQLAKKQFINIILELLKMNQSDLTVTKEEELHTISSLSEIFDEIDYNHTEAVDFEDFVSFLINVAKNSDEISWYKKYVLKRVLSLSGGEENVEKIQYFPTWDKIVVCGRTRKVKILNTQDKNIEYMLPEHSHEGTVLCAEHIPEHRMLVTSSADLTVRFWDIENDHRLRNQLDCRHTGTQTVLTWSPYHNRLLSASRTGTLLVWKRQEVQNIDYNVDPTKEKLESITGKQYNFVMNEDKAMNIHNTNVIGGGDSNSKNNNRYGNTRQGCRVMDMLIKPNHRLVTCSLDSTIKIWDTYRQSSLERNLPELLGVHSKHQKGVFSIAWSEDHSFLISGGFETESFVWISNLKAEPFQLRDQRKPHNTSIVKVAVVPHSPQIITADIKGVVKVWDIRTFQCLQTFFFDSQQPRHDISLHSLCYIPKTKEIVTAGKRVCLFEYERTKHPTHASDDHLVFARYNPETYSFITATTNEIRIWDAFTGHLSKVFSNLCDDEITAVCLDDTGRKFFCGTHYGEVYCFQYATGEFIKKYDLVPPKKSSSARTKRKQSSRYLSKSSSSGGGGTSSKYGYINNQQNNSNSRNNSNTSYEERQRKRKNLIKQSEYLVSGGEYTAGSLRNQKIFEVTSLTYCSEGRSSSSSGIKGGLISSSSNNNKMKKLVATTWQKGVFILNDNDPKEGTIAQKFLTSRHGGVTYHTADVKCSDYSRYLKYIVTADEDHSFFLWELDSMSKKNIAAFSTGMQGEITCVRFLGTYECVIVADSSGYLHLWRVRQVLYRICSWRNYNESTKFSTSVTAIEFDSATKYLYTGDENGFICVWDLEKVILRAGIKPIKSTSIYLKDSSEKNAAKKKKMTTFVPLSNDNVQRQHFWRGHSSAIKNIQIVLNPMCLVSASEDSDVKIFSLDGQFLDALKQEIDEEDLLSNEDEEVGLEEEEEEDKGGPNKGGAGGGKRKAQRRKKKKKKSINTIIVQENEKSRRREFRFPVKKKLEEGEKRYEVAGAILFVHKKLAFMKRWIQGSESLILSTSHYKKKVNRRLYRELPNRRESTPVMNNNEGKTSTTTTFVTEKRVKRKGRKGGGRRAKRTKLRSSKPSSSSSSRKEHHNEEDKKQEKKKKTKTVEEILGIVGGSGVSGKNRRRRNNKKNVYDGLVIPGVTDDNEKERKKKKRKDMRNEEEEEEEITANIHDPSKVKFHKRKKLIL